MITSKLTARSQTTVPPGVRDTLDVQPGEELGYIIEGDGVVRLVNASHLAAEDPVLLQFLEFLGKDLMDDPTNVLSFPEELLERARTLTHGVVIDHDASIAGPVNL